MEKSKIGYKAAGRRGCPKSLPHTTPGRDSSIYTYTCTGTGPGPEAGPWRLSGAKQAPTTSRPPVTWARDFMKRVLSGTSSPLMGNCNLPQTAPYNCRPVQVAIRLCRVSFRSLSTLSDKKNATSLIYGSQSPLVSSMTVEGLVSDRSSPSHPPMGR